MSQLTRRGLIGASIGLSSAALARLAPDTAAAYRTPYKYGKLVLAASGTPGSFDAKSVDCPFVFSANGRFYLCYVGFDGTGYQTGLAESRDLVTWTDRRLILARDPASPVTRYNIAMASICARMRSKAQPASSRSMAATSARGTPIPVPAMRKARQ